MAADRSYSRANPSATALSHAAQPPPRKELLVALVLDELSDPIAQPK
jgi:hypothetical protein